MLADSVAQNSNNLIILLLEKDFPALLFSILIKTFIQN